MRAASIIVRTLADSVLAITSRLLFTLLPIFAALSPCAGQSSAPKRILILFEGSDTPSNFDSVRGRNRSFTKGEPNLNITSVVNPAVAEVLATAYSSAARREAPYLIRSDHFVYVADSPFASATETDRYIYFADLLHDLLDEQHQEIHRALIRIEDVD